MAVTPGEAGGSTAAAAAVQRRLAAEVLRKLRLAAESEDKDDRDIVAAEVFADVTGELNSAARGVCGCGWVGGWGGGGGWGGRPPVFKRPVNAPWQPSAPASHCASLSPAPPYRPQTVQGRCTAAGTRRWHLTSARAGRRQRRCWRCCGSCGASPLRRPSWRCCCTSGCWCTPRRGAQTSG